MAHVYWNEGRYIDICINNSVASGYRASEEEAALRHARKLRSRLGSCVSLHRVIDGEAWYFDFDSGEFVHY